MNSEQKRTDQPQAPARSQEPFVRLVPIDFKEIHRQTGVKRGTIGFSPAWGWCAYRETEDDGPADCAMFTPPPMEPGETELKIEGTNWAFYKPNPSRQPPAPGRG